MESQPLEEVVRNIDERLGLRGSIAAAVAPLATKVDVREEGERTRRYFDVVAERLEVQIRLVAEGQVSLSERFDDFKTEVKAELGQHDRRITRLEARRKP